ncbi:MAG: redoxin domain-containing protein [bacterium]|jgi:thiol-disulfide isomerase/thioredoxin
MFKYWKAITLTLFVLLGLLFFLNKTDKNLKLIVFVAPECPISEAILLNLQQISKEYNNEQLHIQLVIPGSLYSNAEVDSFVNINNIKFEVIIDSNAELVNKYQATITPEVFLILNNQVIYEGAVDDRAVDNEIIKQSATENYLSDAIQNALAGKEVVVKKTKAVGCYIEL